MRYRGVEVAITQNNRMEFRALPSGVAVEWMFVSGLRRLDYSPGIGQRFRDSNSATTEAGTEFHTPEPAGRGDVIVRFSGRIFVPALLDHLVKLVPEGGSFPEDTLQHLPGE